MPCRLECAVGNRCGGQGFTWSDTVANDIKILWGDDSIRNIYAIRDKHYQLHNCNSYFFDNIDRFMLDSYVPTQEDVLQLYVRSTGIAEATYKYEEQEYRFVDVAGYHSERSKWIYCFESVTVVIFCVDLCGYDQVLRRDATQNHMTESLMVFDEVCNSHWFKDTKFVLLLNKTDLFKEKIENVDLTVCWPDYSGGYNFENASTFIKQKFLDQNISKNELFVHFTCAISTENIEFVLKFVREIINHQPVAE